MSLAFDELNSSNESLSVLTFFLALIIMMTMAFVGTQHKIIILVWTLILQLRTKSAVWMLIIHLAPTKLCRNLSLCVYIYFLLFLSFSVRRFYYAKAQNPHSEGNKATITFSAFFLKIIICNLPSNSGRQNSVGLLGTMGYDKVTPSERLIFVFTQHLWPEVDLVP